MSDLSDRQLGHHRVLRQLGAGGMGRVYLAEDTRLGREVALKVLPPELVDDAERLARFEREARTLATLSHPNVVTVHSIEEADGVRFITMEHVEGRTLRELLPEGGLPLERFFELAIPLADALSAAHRKGVTHRDLKPDNVMVTGDGHLKVLDFGLAKISAPMSPADEDRATASVTQDGRILGTVAYMSPEQAQGQPVDHRSDLFSLGVLLYEMATGTRPFTGRNNLSILSSILKDTPPPVTDLRGELPRPLARLIQRALEKRPEDRYQSAQDLRKDLEDLRRDVESGELLSLHTTTSGIGVASVASRPWVRELVVGAALCAVVLAGAWWRQSARRAPAVDAAVPPVTLVDARPSLAVFYFENITGDPSLEWLRAGLTDMLVTDLSQSAGIRVLGTTRLYQILEDVGGLDEKTASWDTIQAVAHRAGVATALVGSFVRAGETLRISVRLQDAASGEIIASERVEGEGEDALFGLVDELTGRVRRQLGIAGVAGAGSDPDLREVTTDSVEAYRYYAEGYMLHERGNDRDAVPKLEKAVELDPEFAMALAKLSVVYGNLQERRKAEEYAGRAVELVEHLPARERYYIQGVYYSKDVATLDQAVEAYRMAVERFPDHSAARNNLAQLLVNFQRHDEAIEHLETLRRQGMRFPGTYQSLAQAYAWVGRPDDGVAVLREFVREGPNSLAGQLNLADYLAGLGRPDEALAVLASVEDLDAGNAEAARTRWVALAQKGDWDAARREVSLLERSENPFDRWSAAALRAVDLAQHGQTAQASVRLASARESAPGMPTLVVQAELSRAEMEIQRGRLEEAVGIARGVRTLEGAADNAAYGRLLAACALTLLDRDAEAGDEWSAFLKVLEVWPAPLAALERRAWSAYLAHLRGEHAAALEALEALEAELPRASPNMGDNRLALYWDVRARTLLALGRPDEAETWFRRIADAAAERLLAPVIYVRSHYELGRIYEARGDARRAREHYRTFVDLWGEGDIDREQVAQARSSLAG